MNYAAGRYRCTLENVTLQTAKTGTPQVVLEIQPEEPLPAQPNAVPIGGPMRRIYLAITDRTMGTPANPGWVTQTMAALGFQGDFKKLGHILRQDITADMSQEQTPDGSPREAWNIRISDRPLETIMPSPQIDALTARFQQCFTGRNPTLPGPGTPPTRNTTDIPKPTTAAKTIPW